MTDRATFEFEQEINRQLDAIPHVHYAAVCKECGAEESGAMWMDVERKGWAHLELYADGTGETSKELIWEWYCPEHAGQDITDILNG